MRRLLALALFVPMSILAAEKRDVIDELLQLPAPPRGEYAEPRPISEKAPPDDAPLPALVEWWSAHTMPGVEKAIPSAAVRERLVEALERQPGSIDSIYSLLPPRADVCERVKRLDASDDVQHWVLHNCASERDELLAVAAQATDVGDGGGGVEKREHLEALARADWNRAEPLLRQFAGSQQPRIRVLAQALLYEHAPDQSLRITLQSVASDSAAPAFARNLAFETLSRSEWDGRDAWLLDRMSDPSLLNLRDGYHGFAPYETIVEAAPEKWIPIMIGLLGHTDGAVRSLAANALGQFHLRDARVDALRPLIPWISNPSWATETGMARLRIIQSVADLGLREAIPHLARVVANDPDRSYRAYAARALADFGDRSGNDAMRAALDSTERGDSREIIIEALMRTGGLSAQELANSVVAFLESNKSSADISYGPEPASAELVIGSVVQDRGTDRDDVAALLLGRATELTATKPELTRKLIELLETWNTPTVHTLLLGRIDQQQATAQTVLTALQKREALRTSSSEALRRLRAVGGMRAGIAAVLIGDAMDQQRILAGTDLEAQRALLATTRIAGDPLPIEAVAALFGRSPALDMATEGWLIDDDRAAARRIVQQRHPGQILILGAPQVWDPVHHTHGELNDWEADLLRRFSASRDEEWIALGKGGTIATSNFAEIRIRGGRATLSYDIDDRARTVAIPRDALDALRLFLHDTNFDDLGPFESGTEDGTHYQYVHLTRASGRRVFMNTPTGEDSPHVQLVEMLTTLVRAADNDADNDADNAVR
jgi:hypothetical protein